MLPLKSKFWDFCSPLAGLLFTLSFSPFEYHYASLLAFFFPTATCLKLKPGRAFFRGYLFGLGLFGLGVSWVFVSIHHFGGAPVSVSILLTSLFVAFWALFPATAVLLTTLLPLKSENYKILAFPFIWILIEYARGNWVLNGFPWLQIAYSQMEGPLAGYIPIVGSYGTGLIEVITVSLLFILVKTRKRILLISGVLLIVWGTGLGLKSVNWTHQIGAPLRVSLIQGNISQDQKWRPEYRESTLQRYKSMTEQHWDSDVIVWPETSIPAYLDEVEDFFIVPLSREAKRHNTDLIVSVPVHGASESEKYNAVITLGKKEGIYRKVHLLPFGEYLPWQPLSGFLVNSLKIRLGTFTPGAINQLLMTAGGYPFITSICYEDVFSERVRTGLPEGAYLVNVANDGWFGNSIEPHQHMQIARMRAMETGRFLLRATNTGLTGIVAPDGKIKNQAPLFNAVVLNGEISPMGGITPYAQWGDLPIICLIAFALGLIVIFEKYLHKSFNI
ncbi:MAG: apolipoprotein N-acyltransferase [Methylosarcina sp.]